MEVVDSDSEPEWEKMQINKAMSGQQVARKLNNLYGSNAQSSPDGERLKGGHVGIRDGDDDALGSSPTFYLWPRDGQG